MTDSDDKNWTAWYVVHTSGNGLRLKKKPTGHEVEGQAGSVSNQVNSRDWSHDIDRVNGVTVARFHLSWAKHNRSVLDMSYTLEEWELYQIELDKDPDQTEVDNFFDLNGVPQGTEGVDC